MLYWEGKRVISNDNQPQARLPHGGGDARFHSLLDVLPAAAYTCDVAGRITRFNQPAVELWGRRPALDSLSDLFCGSHKLFTVGGASVPHNRCWMALALQENQGYNDREIVVERPDGSRRVALAHANPIYDAAGALLGAVNILVDITARKDAEDEVARLNLELEARICQRTAALETMAGELRRALEQIRTLRGLVSVCSWCNRIRDDGGSWQQWETYLCSHTEAEFTHGICPDCSRKQSTVLPVRSPRSSTGASSDKEVRG